jgi:hypothetical protein
MCEFESLYFDDDGYVVRCKQCGHYQLAFISTMLSLTQNEFEKFCQLVYYKCQEPDAALLPNSKCIVIPTPGSKFCLVLSKVEAVKLCSILDEVDTEARVLAMLSMFNKPNDPRR